MTKVYDFKKETYKDTSDYQSGLMERLYGTWWGKALQPLVTHPLFSELLVIKDRWPRSQKKVEHFIRLYGIEETDFEETSYPHFEAFFTRTPKLENRPRGSKEEVLAVADAKLRVFPICEDGQFSVKGQDYRLSDLLQDVELAQQFVGGTLFLYRLGVEDVHRYLYAESGPVCQKKAISGRLHSIRDLVQKTVPVFKENRRQYEVYQTDSGLVLQMEVGALLVGAIHNYSADLAKRGQEKGYFSLGGSSILVLYQKDQITPHPVIAEHSHQGIEVQVQMGQAVGYKKEKAICCHV